MKRNAYILSETLADVLTISHTQHTERWRAILGRFRKLCGALVLAAAGMAQAAPVTYYFGGQLSYVDSNLSPTLAVGNGFSGSFTYESTAADSLPGDPNRGFYGPGPTFTVTINSLPFSITGGGAGSVGVEQLIGTDRFSVGSGDAPTTGTNINGYVAWSFTLFMSDSTGSAFDSDALPSSELNLALFDNSFFQLDFFNEQNLSPTASVGGHLTYLSLTDPNATTSIPEPGSLVLLIIGLAGLALIRLSKKSHQGTSGALFQFLLVYASIFLSQHTYATEAIPFNSQPPAETISAPQQWLSHQHWFCPPNPVDPTKYIQGIRSSMNDMGVHGWEVISFTQVNMNQSYCYVVTYKAPKKRS